MPKPREQIVPQVTAARLRARPLPAVSDGDKETRGRLLVIAGSQDIPGAALLAGEAAFAVGAGKVTLVAPRTCAIALAIALPEARVVPLPARPAGGLLSDSDAVLIGPGMDDKQARFWAEAALGRRDCPPLLLDAAALKKLWNSPAVRQRKQGGGAARCIVTPHAGELATMMGSSREKIEGDPVAAARQAASHLGMIVVLKGATTVIASQQDNVFVHRARLPGLGVSGSGDVLAGLIAGLLARGTGPVDGCLWGVFLHAQAGRQLAASVGSIGYRVRSLSGEIPSLMDHLS